MNRKYENKYKTIIKRKTIEKYVCYKSIQEIRTLKYFSNSTEKNDSM